MLITLLTDIEYQPRQNTYYSRLREDNANVVLRARFLFRFFEVLGKRPFCFLDESWLNKNMVPDKCWTDGSADMEDKVPRGLGDRWIMLAAGLVNTRRDNDHGGWLPSTWKIWKGNVQKEDYHSEMNGDVFEDWFNKFLLPALPNDAVIVLDRAPYHMVRTEESKACSERTKAGLAKWLLDHKASKADGTLYTLQEMTVTPTPSIGQNGKARKTKGMSVAALQTLATSLKPEPVFLVFEWVKQWNRTHNATIDLLFLPVAHPQLNPIELMWSQIKRYVRTNNKDWNMPELKRLAEEKRDSLSAMDWKNSFAHTEKFARLCWKADQNVARDRDGVEADEEEVVE